MSVERVREYFEGVGMGGRVVEFDASSATVELAAAAIGCEPERIAKTLSFLVKGVPTLVVMAGDGRIDNQKFKARFHAKPKMLKAEEAAGLVGHPVGGVCPFAVNDGVEVYLDESLRRFETVWPAAGSPNSAIELTLAELEEHSHALAWVDVCKSWE